MAVDVAWECSWNFITCGCNWNVDAKGVCLVFRLLSHRVGFRQFCCPSDIFTFRCEQHAESHYPYFLCCRRASRCRFLVSRLASAKEMVLKVGSAYRRSPCAIVYFSGNVAGTKSVGAWPVAGRVNSSPNFVAPAVNPPVERKNSPFSTPMKRSRRAALPVGSWENVAVVCSCHWPSAARNHWLP